MEALASDCSGTPTKPADHLCAQLQSAWSTLADLIRRISESSSTLGHSPRTSASLRAACEHYGGETHVLLVEPAEHFLRCRPIWQSLEALREFDSANASGPSWIRTRIDDRFQNVLARAALDLCEPWRIWRRGNHADEWHAWQKRIAAQSKEASSLLDGYARWAGRANPGGAKGQRSPTLYETWWRRERAVSALIRMEVSLRGLGVAWLAAAEDFTRTAQSERELVLAATSRTLAWIRCGAGIDSAAPAETPAPASLDDHLRTWWHSIQAETASRLPERVELVTPGWYPRWRSVAARECYRATFSTFAEPGIRHAVERHWKETAEAAWEVARARKIVDYWRSAPDANSSAENSLFEDARRNAATMLERQATQASAGIEELEGDLATAFWVWTEEGSTSLEAAQFGWAALMRPPRAFRILNKAIDAGQRRARLAAQRVGGWAARRWDRTLELFGGRVPAQPTQAPVIRRTTLRDTLSLPVSKSELPGLYRSLFRIAPVDDKRFLIGRERELAGLAQALADWEGGRFAACLVVGDRGSGKTSLLNCAEKETLGHHVLIRGQFGDRAIGKDQIDCFLRQLLELEQAADVEAALAARRRILVIEECERIYLRKVGGFSGGQYMIHLIQRTAPTTLWIIAMNDKSARVLEAGARWRRVFSHRINAMNVSRTDLENAILERHRLSGLRLQFAPPPAGDPRVSRAKHWLGLHDSAQKLFFDSLFQQSEGVFRSAFELWLSSIERVEEDVVRIRQPLAPAFEQFRGELAQEDHFTLLAIQEHGSLTEDELAQVLCEMHDTSRSRLDRLFALGLIEPDPEHPGMRVRPEAQRFANDLLRRANLT